MEEVLSNGAGGEDYGEDTFMGFGSKVIIAFDDTTLINVILRPQAWPNFRKQYVQIVERLKKLEWGRVMKEDRSTNTGAFLIAQSVIKGGYYQSYVAEGPPFWLCDLFESEEAPPCV
ncbi:hypothetical protein F2Q68_00023619 [Brassica cretica]|uniref:Uncharacterized protein n=1 Tax=Brassica cretica TaxID=69181 RepID=A0A8S9FW35_BRACR|nr:hypothetical protein F2Q68_00023619 [Brassica cretica]